MVSNNFVRFSATLHMFIFHASSLFQRSLGTALFPCWPIRNFILHFFSVWLNYHCQKVDIMSHLKTFLYLRYIMLGMRSALSTIETKQVNYQIFICIFFLWVTSPRMGIRLWGTEGRLCLPCHIHSYTSSTRRVCWTRQTSVIYIFLNLIFQTPCHQFYEKEPVM